MDKPNWAYWVNLAEVELRGAVELSCDIAPGSMDHFDADSHITADVRHAKREVESRLRIAHSHASAGTLSVEHRTLTMSDAPCIGDDQMFVKLVDFRAWGETLPVPLTFPAKFPKASERAASAGANLGVQEGGAVTDKGLDIREKKNMLRVIRALSVMAGLKGSRRRNSRRSAIETAGLRWTKGGDDSQTNRRGSCTCT